MRRQIVAVVAVVALSSFAGHSVLGASLYTVTDLGTLGGSSSWAYGINASGQVVGAADTSSGYQHAFLYSGGMMMDLGTLGGDSSSAKAINDAGLVVGVSATNISGDSRAFIYRRGTKAMTDLLGISSSASAINNIGQVVGNISTSHGTDAFLYSGNTVINIGTLFPTGINANAQVVGYIPAWTAPYGWRAFSYSDGSLTPDLGNLGGIQSLAYGVNNIGQVVGSSDIASGYHHAFLYNSETMTDLGTLGSDYSSAAAINNIGQVVGNSYTAEYNLHAFLYSNGMMTDLNNMIATASGWTLENANAINDVGQIVGWGYNSLGQEHAFLLTPTPEPASIILLGVGVLSVFAYAWQRRGRIEPNKW
jgi:probable HAF family extracellular repeat protein